MSPTNSLLTRLPREQRMRLLAAGEQVTLTMEQVLYSAGAPIRHVYFPTAGFVSLVTLVDQKPVVEVGMVGFEGLLGLPLVLGVKTAPFHAVVQGDGLAWRIPQRTFLQEFRRSSSLQRLAYLYTHISMLQLSTSATCLSLHRLGPRLARWLLMTQDRARRDRFKVTHEFLAYMLGVQRAGVSLAAKSLQDRRLIEYRRGDVAVLDRRGLETASCSCYAADLRMYSKLLP